MKKFISIVGLVFLSIFLIVTFWSSWRFFQCNGVQFEILHARCVFHFKLVTTSPLLPFLIRLGRLFAVFEEPLWLKYTILSLVLFFNAVLYYAVGWGLEVLYRKFLKRNR